MVSFGTHWSSCFAVISIIVLCCFVSVLDMFGRGTTCTPVDSFVSNIFLACD